MNRVVIGVGNRLRGDDGVGLAVVERLRRYPPADTSLIGLESVSPDLFQHWSPSATVVLVDAATSGAPPGTIRTLDALAAPLPADALRLSTHGFGLAEAIELARALTQLPAKLSVFAVEGATFEHGLGLTDAVDAAADEVAARIRAELESDRA